MDRIMFEMFTEEASMHFRGMLQSQSSFHEFCVQFVLESRLNRGIEQWINNVKKATAKPSRESRSTSITTVESIISNDSPETAASIYGCEPVVRLAESYGDLGFPRHSRYDGGTLHPIHLIFAYSPQYIM